MYKSFDFDLNVLLNSVQITYADDNETIIATPTQTELGWTAVLANDKSLGTAVAWETYTAPAAATPTYSAVTPVDNDNPQEKGWYELNGTDYVLTADTTVVDGKTYYQKTS